MSRFTATSSQKPGLVSRAFSLCKVLSRQSPPPRPCRNTVKLMPNTVPVGAEFAREEALETAKSFAAMRRSDKHRSHSYMAFSDPVASNIHREVTQDNVRPGALDRPQAFANDTVLVDGSGLGTELDHRVLAADLIRRQRQA